MSRRILPLLLVALAALLTGLSVWPEAEDPTWPVEMGKRVKVEPTPVEVPADEPEEPEPDPVVAEVPVTEPVVAEPEPPAPPPKPQRSWTLEIEVTPEPAPDEVLAISVLPCDPGVEPDPRAYSMLGTQREGKWVVDVTDFFKPPREKKSQLRVEVARPGYLTKVTHAVIKDLSWTRVGEKGLKQATAVHRVLVHRANHITGTAFDEKGEPVAGARVWLVAADKGRKQFKPADNVLTDASGKYEIEVPFDGKWFAVGLMRGFRPVTRSMPKVGESKVVDLNFERGESIDVEVTISGEPVAGMAVSIWNRGRKPKREGQSEAWLGKDSVCWEGNQVEWLALKTQTDEKGRARITGLDRSMFNVVSGRYSQTANMGYSFKGQLTAQRVKLPLDETVEFSFNAAEIHVSLAGEPGPNCAVSLLKSDQLLTTIAVNEDKACTFMVTPSQVYTAKASGGAGEVKIPVGEAGTVSEIELSSKCE